MPPPAPAARRRTPAALALALLAACGGDPGPAVVEPTPADAAAPAARTNAAPVAPAAKRDIVLLLVDTLRADHLELYGYPRATAPNLAAFAEDAIVFDQVVAPAPWTLPSVGSVMTGAYPSVHGLRAKEGGGAVTALRDGVVTLAERLQAEGYRTAAVVSNPWMRGKHHGLQRGFEEYRTVQGHGAAEVNAAATRILRAEDERPLFLYLHYMGPHGPYHRHPVYPEDVLGPLPAELDRPLTPAELATLPDYLRLEDAEGLGDYVERYDGAIRAWDEEFGEWIRRFERRAPEAAPIVAVIADHGEEFVEHGGWNHGEALYAEQVRVPWILRVPGLAPRRVTEHAVGLIDVAPTLLALVGASIPATMAGQDVLGRPVDPARALFAETDIRMGGIPDPAFVQRSVRVGVRELIQRPGAFECYDLRLDPRQLDPACDDADGRGELEARLAEWERLSRKAAELLGESQGVELDEGVQQELRELGYSGGD